MRDKVTRRDFLNGAAVVIGSGLALDRIAGDAGFVADRDVAAITVNRWGHGYAYAFNPLFDREPADGKPLNEVGRVRVGNVAIANSDAAWDAYAHAAMDEAYRAVGELL